MSWIIKCARCGYEADELHAKCPVCEVDGVSDQEVAAECKRRYPVDGPIEGELQRNAFVAGVLWTMQTLQQRKDGDT